LHLTPHYTYIPTTSPFLLIQVIPVAGRLGEPAEKITRYQTISGKGLSASRKAISDLQLVELILKVFRRLTAV
jgi:hypothetical protein